MGAKKKKTQKQKDFVKPKLKVGKTAPKAANHTDTSFVAKAISLPHQSLTAKTGTNNKSHGKSSQGIHDVDLSHQLSLTKHHSSSTRKEVLNYIELHLPSNPSAYNNILNSITPLIIDKSLMVRTALVSLLTAIAKKQPGLIELHARSLILFIHSAMTHILPPVRNDSTKYLEILIDYGAEPLVKSSFVKTLRTFCQLLNWQLDIESKRSLSLSVTTSSVDGGSAKLSRSYHLQVLKKFLEKGAFKVIDDSNEEEKYLTIHPLTSLYMIPSAPQPYAHLKLFVNEMTSNINTTSEHIDLNNISSEDVETRRRILVEFFKKPMKKGLTDFIKEGGEVGKEVSNVLKVLEQAVEDEEELNKITD